NTGTTPLARLRAYTKSDNAVLDRREFVFGQLLPGEKRTWTVPIKIPRYMPSRRDDVTLKWEDDAGDPLEDARAETDIAELPRPAAPAVPLAAATQAVRVQVDTLILATAQEAGAKLATVKKGAVLSVHGKAGPFWRVEWQKGRMGFLPIAAGKEAPGAKPNLKTVSELMQSEAPAIRLANLDTSRGGVETDQDHLSLTGSAVDVNGMRDLQI